MTRVSRIIGLPVVRDGKRLGIVHGVSLSRDGRQLAGLHMQGPFLRGSFVPSPGILLLGAKAVLVEELPMKRVEPFQLRKVRDTSGLKLGMITDALIEERDLTVEAVELSFGPVDDLLQGRAWVRSYSVEPETGDVIVACDTWLNREGGTLQ